ncbi:hypothetical protein [Nitrososphaera sp. AFS]|nr:hypothetical protein [Nitrososphaera sp. AFS]
MEIIESVSWVALGFIPTLLLLETCYRVRIGRKKSLLKKVPPLTS